MEVRCSCPVAVRRVKSLSVASIVVKRVSSVALVRSPYWSNFCCKIRVKGQNQVIGLGASEVGVSE